MEKAIECALILTKKHQQFTIRINTEISTLKRQELKLKQGEITHQIIQFLEEIQEYKHLFVLDTKIEKAYQYLVNYYSKEIHLKINQYQTKLNIITFEEKMTSSFQENQDHFLIKNSQKIIQKKLKTYFQFFKKGN